ncbi:tRNA uridine-5-carboxymethylaminomethyl(34) synthesis GTPase MnmE [Alkalibacter saccharofermentans]|uniref:tRNA modification GTPase MnmE n=1 Tax=Alkalibacter saccharofermentans DSM 14828 TaxID=1120975 RepID=A0A1M4T684_9FIRM|nr:tRNA uridine-5-carboxymethylaminomethyl(34) synthesis GTPase MnmE [Alkalibacter saccharofermentans]SHE39818.1 tRNA modification GTPase trmE [Alkalibacter saccharofermentans DSM 14828]
MNYLEDTVAAISTPVGFSGIGMVRMTGDKSVEVIKKIFVTKSTTDFDDYKNRSIIYGHIVDEKGQIVDEVLVSKMLGPNTYTREDVIEISCHGGIIPVRKILELTLANGARMAEPGEFTKRAFLNGRIDLTQAEAVIDVINSKTDRSLQMSVKQLEGRLSKKVKEIRNDLIEILAHIEASIDYPEYDIEEMSFQLISQKSNDIKFKIDKLIQTSKNGRIIREGIKTAIIGKPNVGKSSLLNALLGEERAIVTEFEGTTRDTIEEYINIKGIPLKIIDTAGIRETENLIEKLGINKTKEILSESDFVLLLLDGERGIDEEDMALLQLVKDKKGLVAINKIDRKLKVNKEDVRDKSHMEVVEISILKELGIEELKNKIYDEVSNAGMDSDAYEMVSNIRHINLLQDSSQSLNDCLEGLDSGLPIEMISVDVKNAWDKLGKMIGETVTEDIVDEIFSKFCIGK